MAAQGMTGTIRVRDYLKGAELALFNARCALEAEHDEP